MVKKASSHSKGVAGRPESSMNNSDVENNKQRAATQIISIATASLQGSQTTSTQSRGATVVTKPVPGDLQELQP